MAGTRFRTTSMKTITTTVLEDKDWTRFAEIIANTRVTCINMTNYKTCISFAGLKRKFDSSDNPASNYWSTNRKLLMEMWPLVTVGQLEDGDVEFIRELKTTEAFAQPPTVNSQPEPEQVQ